jgi:siroheme decarboxylase
MQLTQLEKCLLNDFQHTLPLSPTPYADMAAQLGVSEQEVLAALGRLKEGGMISRVGAVFRPNSIGASTLAAMAVPPERLEAVAAIVNSYSHVNHNYEREHDYNLWFVATARDEEELCQVLEDMENRTGLAVLALPLLEDYHIDLGFDLRWT